MIKQLQKIKGFTLLEMLMVMVIISSVIYMMIGYVQQRTLQTQIDRSVVQMQQILNAGLAYYVDNGKWPTDLACLQGLGAAPDCSTSYLPTTINNPLSSGAQYETSVSAAKFVVRSRIKGGKAPRSYNIATFIANRLPLAFTSNISGTPGTCKTTSTTCYVYSSVTIPGQNLNSIGAVTFAGLYHHGGCVPVPTCPVDAGGNTMTPQIMVVPVSVSGVNDPSSSNVYPISSFTAYATGGNDSTPGKCSDYSAAGTSCGTTIGTPQSNKYWRACLQVVTEKGEVAETNDATGPVDSFPYEPWGGSVTLMAITRCAVANEPSGSDFSVFTR